MRLLRYIEWKTGYSDNGPAWIGFVTPSRSGRTVYFNGRALKRIGGRGASGGNHHDAETGEEFWVSGVKRDGNDRHWAGGGRVFVQSSALTEYLNTIGANSLSSSQEVTDRIVETDVRRFEELENTSPYV